MAAAVHSARRSLPLKHPVFSASLLRLTSLPSCSFARRTCAPAALLEHLQSMTAHLLNIARVSEAGRLIMAWPSCLQAFPEPSAAASRREVPDAVLRSATVMERSCDQEVWVLRLASRMALRSLAEGRSQKMRRWNLRSTASSRSCGRLVAPSTTILSADGPLPLRASLAQLRACSLHQQLGCCMSHCSHAAPS